MSIGSIFTAFRGLLPKRKVPERFSYSNKKCKACKRVVISDRAFISIMAEAISRDPVETGGVLFGAVSGDTMYVVEATDPGKNAFHSTVHLEMNTEYLNHVFPVISRLYKHDLDLLGLWHRHPGDFNRFSEDDDATNARYAEAIGGGTLSILLNFTPDGKLTVYYYDASGTGQYFMPQVDIGDSFFAGTDFLKLADTETLYKRKRQLQEEINND